MLRLSDFAEAAENTGIAQKFLGLFFGHRHCYRHIQSLFPAGQLTRTIHHSKCRRSVVVSKVCVSCRVAIGLVFLSMLSGDGGMVPSLQARGHPPSTIELRCRIVAAQAEQRQWIWLIELSNAAGEPLRRAYHMVGDTIRFKGLQAGIYRICVFGREGRHTCESVDLTPAPDRTIFTFDRDIRTPSMATPVTRQYGISITSLMIPKGALQEMQSADKAMLASDDQATIRHLVRATEIAPDFAEAWNNLGTLCHKKGDYQQAMQDFKKVTELEPDSYVGWANLGASLLASGRFAEAIEAEKTALNLSPDDAVIDSQLGLSYYYLRDYADAWTYLKRALDLDPAMAVAPQLYLARIALINNEVGNAVDYLRSYLKYHPYAQDAHDVEQTLGDLGK